MKLYLAQSETEAGMASHDFEAEDWDQAARIADENGWELLGTFEGVLGELEEDLEEILRDSLGLLVRGDETVH